jgi:hypothetical protein
MRTPELTYVLEGITVNSAAELIYGTPGTTVNRKFSRNTYLRCLEDVAQALIFSDKIIVSGKLPEVGGEHPGMDFLDKMGDEKVRKIKDNKEFDDKEFLADPQIIEITKKYLNNLDKSYLQDNLAWKEFILREYKTYFFPKNNKEIVYVNESFVFGKNYVIHKELEQAVSPKFINKLVMAIINNSKVNQQKATPEQLISFIQRVALTHVLIWLNYKKQFNIRRIPDYNKNYLPSFTRSTLSINNSNPNAINVVAWKTLLPRLLAPFMKMHCKKREDILDIIPVLAAEYKPRRYRELFLDAVFEFKEGNIEKLETLRIDLESLFKDEKHKRTWGLKGTVNPFEGTLGLGIEHEFQYSLKKSKMIKNLERSINRLPEMRYEPFEIEARRLFPELYES